MIDGPLFEPPSASGLPTNGPVAEISAIFAELFDVDAVGQDEDFFAIGGDSLIAERLVAEIERRFGVSFSMSILMDAPTPETLAAAVVNFRKVRRARVLVPVRQGGDGPVLVCVHGVDGESMLPVRLAEALHHSGPIYGFRALGLEAGEEPMDTVEGMADLYLAALAEAAPHRRYVILGHCGGTMVAWEMAQKLLAAGGDVAGLIVIDPESLRYVAPFLHESGMNLRALQAEGARWSSVRRSDDRVPAYSMRKREVQRRMYQALAWYVPATYTGPALLVVSTERAAILLNKDRGYQHLLPAGRFVEIDTAHSDLFQEKLGEVAAVVGHYVNGVLLVGSQIATPVSS